MGATGWFTGNGSGCPVPEAGDETRGDDNINGMGNEDMMDTDRVADQRASPQKCHREIFGWTSKRKTGRCMLPAMDQLND